MPITRTEAIIVFCFLFFFILVMISFIVFILFYVEKKQKGYAEKLIAVKANYEMELYKAELEIQEQTLMEIAREIHDDVGQIISLAKLNLGTLDLERKNETEDTIAEISDILEKALDHLRHLSRSMNSEMVKNGGLKNSIEMLVIFLQRGGKYNTHFNVMGDHFSLNGNKEIIMFRILQEAMNNIFRHSKATDICISLCYNKPFIKLQIKDNGEGFNINEQVKKSNLINGINNMRQRAKLIDAEFQLESNIGTGTTITITTPI